MGRASGAGDRGSDEPRDEHGLQTELLGVGDVLPGAAAAGLAALRLGAEVPAALRDARGRGTEDLDQVRGHDPVGAGLGREPHANPLARNRERHRDPAPSRARDAVTREIERLDVDVDGVTVTGSGRLGQALSLAR